VVVVAAALLWFGAGTEAHAFEGAQRASSSVITLRSALSTVTAGQKVALSSETVPRTTNQGRYIYVRATTNGRRWKTIGRMTYNTAYAKYVLKVAPATLTAYRAVLRDRAGRIRDVSPTVLVRTRVRIRFWSTAYSPAVGRRVRLFGALWPAHYRRLVHIQLKQGSAWTTLFKSRTDRRGRFKGGLFKPRTTGTYYVRALTSAPDGTHLSNSVGPKRIRVVKSTMPAEGRAVWVSRYEYRSKADIRRIMRSAWEGNLNIVYFQVRGQGDAYYDCPTTTAWAEPWAARLSATKTNPTGTLGKDPGWDPLAYAITWAHWYGLELHAWMNVYPIWYGRKAPPRTTPLHLYHKGSSWRVATRFRYKNRWYHRHQGLNRSYLWASPGKPAIRTHVRGIASYLAGNYDIDGIHLDKVQYPGRAYSWDESSTANYAAANAQYKATHDGRSLSWALWQRRQVSALVREVYVDVKNIDPTIQVSAACRGIFVNRWRWPGVKTGAVDYYQDSQGWLSAGIVDFLAPTIFWDMKGIPKWDTLARDFAARRRGRFVYPGIASYMYRNNWTELSNEVQASRTEGAQGASFYSWTSLKSRWVKLSSELFTEFVDVPSRGRETALSLESTATVATPGDPVTVFGTLLPYYSGARVTVLRRVGIGWTTVGTATTDRFGRYEVTYVPTGGSQELRAIFKGDASNGPATTRVLTIPAGP